MADDADRLRAVLRRLHEEGLSLPWFDCTKPYNFLAAPEEQAQGVKSWEPWWAKPEVSLREFLNRRRDDITSYAQESRQRRGSFERCPARDRRNV